MRQYLPGKDHLHGKQLKAIYKLNKVLNIIKEAGSKGLRNDELANKCKFLTTFEKTDIIKDLKEANRISI